MKLILVISTMYRHILIYKFHLFKIIRSKIIKKHRIKIPFEYYKIVKKKTLVNVKSEKYLKSKSFQIKFFLKKLFD